MTPRPCGGLSHAVYGPGEAVIIVAHPLAAAAAATLEGAVREVIDVQPGRGVIPSPGVDPAPDPLFRFEGSVRRTEIVGCGKFIGSKT